MRKPRTTHQNPESLTSPVASLSLEMPGHCSTHGPVDGLKAEEERRASDSRRKEGALIPIAGGLELPNLKGESAV